MLNVSLAVRFVVRVVVRKRMAILLHADFRNSRTVAFVAGAEGRHASHVGLERQNNDVVHRSEIVSEAFE